MTVPRRTFPVGFGLLVFWWAVTLSPVVAEEMKAGVAPKGVAAKTSNKVQPRTAAQEEKTIAEKEEGQNLRLFRRTHLINNTPPKVRPLHAAFVLPPEAVPAVSEPRADPALQVNVTSLTPTAVGNVKSTINEPSLAVTKRNEVLFTGNWYGSVSRSGPSGLSYVSPENTFPNSPFAYCCDQVALYSEKHDLLIWFLQYRQRTATTGNIVRIAVANQADIAAGQWTYYDFAPTDLGPWSDEWFDFPDVAATDKNLYVTTNSFKNTGSGFGRAVAFRIPLDQLAAKAATITPDVFSRSQSFSFRLTQGATDTMYFASHDFSNYGERVELFTWADAAANPNRSTAKVQIWSDDDYLSECLDKVGNTPTVWLSGNRTDPRMTAGWVQGKEVGFAWTASRGNGFAHPHVRVAVVDMATTAAERTPVAQPHLQNTAYAFATPAVSLSRDGKTVGLTVCYGGGRVKNPSQAVGVLMKDGTTYSWKLATAGAEGSSGPSSKMWGDYCAARPDPRFNNVFVASGWTMEGGREMANVTPRFVTFSLGTPDQVTPGEVGTGGNTIKADVLAEIKKLEDQHTAMKVAIDALKAKVATMPDVPPAVAPAVPKK